MKVIYQTKDGRQFFDESVAESHEVTLDAPGPYHYTMDGKKHFHNEPEIWGAEVRMKLGADRCGHSLFVEGVPPPDRLVLDGERVALPAKFFVVPPAWGA